MDKKERDAVDRDRILFGTGIAVDGKRVDHATVTISPAAPAPSSLAGEEVESVLREARKWIAGQPERSTSEYQTSFAMLEAIEAALSPEATRGTSTATPGGWLVRDHADGWFWTPTKIAAVAALTEGHRVYSISRGEYEAAPFTDKGAEERYITDAYELSPEAPAREASSAIASIMAERTRQVDVEGWTPEHDDEHDDYSLGLAAAAYAGGVDCGSKVVSYTDDVSGGRGDTPVWRVRKKRVPVPWPEAWDARWWKPTGDRRRDLVKAGALIVAEIERLDRQSLSTTNVEGC